MRTVTNGLLMIAGACVTLGLIHLRFWLLERSRRDYLAFVILCFSVAAFSGFELALMHSTTPDEYIFWARWSHLVIAPAMISVAWFACLNLGGRTWLFYLFCASRILTLILNFLLTPNINFREINSIGKTIILGESLSYPIGIPNPWMLLPHASFILLIIFCIDASHIAWRRGEHSKALIFGTGVFLFTLFAFILTVGVLWGFVKMPVLSSLAIFFVIVAVLYDLNYNMHGAAMLTKSLIAREGELRETLEQLQLSAIAANVGIWTRRLTDGKLWVSEKTRSLFGFTNTQPVEFGEFLQRIHPDDREKVRTAIEKAINGDREYNVEYRIVLDDGEFRWIDSRGKVEFSDGKPSLMRGASVDVTKRKIAEEAVHELGRKLMDAQEKERARLARELHDDLSQSLALLSIQLAELRKENADPQFIKKKVDQLTSQIQGLSSDVHRISHELHPAKLSQLGLESALRGFCREMSKAHPIKIDFEAENVPRSLPNDISLCLYRVTQESLQNVVKHSGASAAHVDLKFENREVRLVISDNGAGFNPQTIKSKESLGLISIDERIRTVKGKVKVLSTIGSGTRIEARVPLPDEN